MNTLYKNILSTLIYYDIMDYPMTDFEIWKYLIFTGNKKEDLLNKKIRLGEVMRCLENKELEKKVDHFAGFHFLTGRKEIVIKRIENNKLSEQKFKIIKKVVFWLRFLPYVRMIAVTGTVAMKNALPKSDLDLLIVFKSGRIFFGRALVTLVVHLMGKRRYGNKIADKICLNCFITDISLKSRQQDLFSSSEYSFITPLFGQETFREFQKENQWIGRFRFDLEFAEINSLKAMPEGGFSRMIRKNAESFFDLNIFNRLEKRLEKWQTERIARDPRTWEKGSVIVADSRALIFFHCAHAPLIEKSFQSKLKKLT